MYIRSTSFFFVDGKCSHLSNHREALLPLIEALNRHMDREEFPHWKGGLKECLSKESVSEYGSEVKSKAIRTKFRRYPTHQLEFLRVDDQCLWEARKADMS